jgi:hypothetical protein
MYAIEFNADIENGIVQIPSEYIEIREKKNAKILVLIDNEKSPVKKKRLSAISIDTSSYKFDREDANER